MRAVDGDGFASPIATTSWLLDATAPVVSVLSGPPQSSTVATSAATVGVSTNEPATLECSLDAGAWAACGTSVSLASVTDGQHTFAVRATDVAGNVGAPVLRRWTVDTAAPETTFSSGATGGPTTSTSATFGLATSENAAYSCRLDAATWAPCTSPVTYSGLVVGTHTVQVTAKDAAGNADPTPASTTWTVTAPITIAPADRCSRMRRTPVSRSERS